MRKAIQPLTRKLAMRLARNGATCAGERSISVRPCAIPFPTAACRSNPLQAPQSGQAGDLVIADVSGSVAAFARFTLHLVHAISSQFSKVRSFVFIDGIDEVTRSSNGPRP